MPTIIAHRGLHERFPENSLGALKAAWDRGIQWCECDIHFSSDGVPVVLHDATLRRMAGRIQRVAELTWEQLHEIHLVDGVGLRTEERIPSLDQVLEAIPEGCHLLVEVKPLLQENGPNLLMKLAGKSVVVQSFHEENLHALAGPGMRLAWLIEYEWQIPRAVSGPWRTIHLAHRLLNPTVAKQLHNAGKQIGAWTVNEAEEWRRLVELGVDWIITDSPLQFRP